MSKTQQAIYFASVCVGIVCIGLLMLGFGYKEAHAATLVQQPDSGSTITPINTGIEIGTFTLTPELQAGATTTVEFYSGGTTNTFTENAIVFCSDADPTCNSVNYGFAADDFSSAKSPQLVTMTMGNSLGSLSVGDTIHVAYKNYANGSNAETLGDSLGIPYVLLYTGTVAPSDNTYIQITAPVAGTSTPSTTFDLNVTYNIGTDIPTFSLGSTTPERMGINFVLVDNYGRTINLGTDWDISTTTGAYTYATTTTVSQADYTITANLLGDYGFTPATDNCTPYPPFVTCAGVQNINTLASDVVSIVSIANGTLPQIGFTVGNIDSRNGLATTTCDALHVGGCFQNALAFLFFPSPDALNNFNFLWTTIQNKPPFGYVPQTITALKSLGASTTPAFSIGTIPFMDTIFTPLKEGISGLMWFLFAIVFYRGRLRHLDI